MEENRKYRLPGLDGLRAIAILLIVLGHCSQADFWYGDCPLPRLPLPGGALSIFFVLSGFLAGYYSETITDAKSYYLKKAKRLFPVYYIYIILVVLVYLLIGRSTEVLNWKLLYYIVPAGIIPFCQAQGILPLVHLWFLTPIVIAYLLFPVLLKAFRGGVTKMLSINTLHLLRHPKMDFVRNRRKRNLCLSIPQCLPVRLYIRRPIPRAFTKKSRKKPAPFP